MRALLTGAPAPPRDAGATVWRGVIEGLRAPPELCPPGCAAFAASPDGRTLALTSLGAGAGALHGGAVAWVLCLPGPRDAAAPPLPAAADVAHSAHAEARALAWLAAARDTPLAAAAGAPSAAERIAAAFRDFAHVPALLAATPAGCIVERRLFYRDVGDDVARAEVCPGAGAVTLLGDAALAGSPALGVGACLSLQSAAALGAALDALPRGAGGAELADALRRFESGQRGRAAAAAAAARAAARAAAARGAHGGADAAPPLQPPLLPASGADVSGWLLGNAARGSHALR